MADEFQMPEDLKGKSPEDLARMYTETRSEYDKFKGEWEPRSKDWEAYQAYGKPDEIKQIVDWGKTVAPVWQKIAKGEAYLLNDADYKAYKNWADKTGNGTRQPQETTSQDDELFGPVKKSLREELFADLKKEVDQYYQRLGGEVQRGYKTLQDQQNLFAHVIRQQRLNPNLDIDSILAKGAKLAQMPADELVNHLIEAEAKSAGMEGEIEKRVAAALAERDAAKQNDTVKTLLDNRRGSGNLPLSSPKRVDVMKGLIKTLNDRHPGILEQIPMA